MEALEWMAEKKDEWRTMGEYNQKKAECRCKELIISVNGIKGFEKGVGKDIYIDPRNLKRLAEGNYFTND